MLAAQIQPTPSEDPVSHGRPNHLTLGTRVSKKNMNSRISIQFLMDSLNRTRMINVEKCLWGLTFMKLKRKFYRMTINKTCYALEFKMLGS